MLTATAIGGRPARCQARACRQASRRTHWPIGTMRPQSSAIGTNCAGRQQPALGMHPADQRLGAGDRRRSRDSIFGW